MRPRERFAVIGDPIGHSLSPAMHTAAFVAAGIDASYEGQLVAVSALPDWVERAGSVPYAGFNVTIPHKETIGSYLETLDHSAQMVGAVNTVVNTSGRLTGYNTDVSGFAATVLALRRNVAGSRAVVLGAGGSARAVVRALEDLGATIAVCSRSTTRAAHMLSSLGIAGRVFDLSSTETKHAVETADLLINTTPLGMPHLPVSPLPERVQLDARTLVIDLVYGAVTPLLQQADAAGCVAVDGIEMLVRQGSASFTLWTGVEPNLNVMRAACRHALMEVQTCSAS